MGSPPDPGGSAPPSFDDFQRQTSLMTSCTLLWKELSDHFSNLERDLIDKSNALKAKIQAIDDDTKLSLDSLEARESSISKSMLTIFESLENNAKALMERKIEVEGDGSDDLLEKLRGFCVGMCSKEFWSFMITKKKDLECLRSEIPKALSCCVDPPRFVLEAISDAFPINNYIDKSDEKRNSISSTNSGNSYKNHGDLGWACVLLLESLIPVVMDPVLGKERMIVTPRIKGKAEEIAESWKKSLEERGGIENVKTPDVHTFLQHLVTFEIVKEEDVDFYRKLVVGSAWRKQMPKLAVALGLEDKMPDMIEELIGRGQQVDAVHFIYEVGLVEKFPPVPLLKAFLQDAKKVATSISEDSSNSGRAVHLATKKEQSAIRAVLRCIEEYKLESQISPENLNKRLEQLDKARLEKKKQPATGTLRSNHSKLNPKMVKFLKPNKAVIVLQGRFAGHKAVIVKNFDEGTRDRAYGHCLVAGVAKYPSKVIRKDSAKKQAKKSRVKAFIKVVNYNHIMPTRYTLDVDLKEAVNLDALASRDKKVTACKDVKAKFEERFKTGKNRWFFSKLRF